MNLLAHVAFLVFTVVSVGGNPEVGTAEKSSGGPRTALPTSSWVLIAVLVSSAACALSVAYAWAYHASRQPQSQLQLEQSKLVETKLVPTRSDSGLSVVSFDGPSLKPGGMPRIGSISPQNLGLRKCSQSLLDVGELRALNLLPESPSLFSGLHLRRASARRRTRQSSASSTASNASDGDDDVDGFGPRSDAATSLQMQPPMDSSSSSDPKSGDSCISSPIPTLLCPPPNTPLSHATLRRHCVKALPQFDVNELRVPQLLAEAVALDTDPVDAQRQWQSPQLQVMYKAWRTSLQHRSTRAMWPADWIPIAKPFLGGNSRTSSGMPRGPPRLPMGASAMYLARNVRTWEVRTVHMYLEKRVGKSILQQIEQFITEVGESRTSESPPSAARSVAHSTCKLCRHRPNDPEFLVQFIELYERAVLHVHPYSLSGPVESTAPQPICFLALWSAILDVGTAVLALPTAMSYRSLFAVQAQKHPDDTRPRFQLALAIQSRPMYSPIATRSPAQALLIDVVLPLANLHGHPPTPALWEQIASLVPQSSFSKLAHDLWTSRNPMQAIRDAVALAETSLVSLGVFHNPSSMQQSSVASARIIGLGQFKHDDFGDQCYDSDLSSDECDASDAGSGSDDETVSDSDGSSRFVELPRKPLCECGTCSSCLRREAFEIAAAKGRRREGRRRKPTAREHAPTPGQDNKWNVIESKKLQDALRALASSQKMDPPPTPSSPLSDNPASAPRRNPSILRAVAGGLLSLAVDYVHGQIKHRLHMDGGDAIHNDDTCFASIPTRDQPVRDPSPSSPWIPAQKHSVEKPPHELSSSAMGHQLRITQPKLHQQLLKRGTYSRKGKSDKRIKTRVRGVQSWWEEDAMVL